MRFHVANLIPNQHVLQPANSGGFRRSIPCMIRPNERGDLCTYLTAFLLSSLMRCRQKVFILPLPLSWLRIPQILMLFVCSMRAKYLSGRPWSVSMPKSKPLIRTNQKAATPSTLMARNPSTTLHPPRQTYAIVNFVDLIDPVGDWDAMNKMIQPAVGPSGFV